MTDDMNSAENFARWLNDGRFTPSKQSLYHAVIPAHPAVDRIAWAEWAYCVGEGYWLPFGIPTSDGLMVVWVEPDLRWDNCSREARELLESMVQNMFERIAVEQQQDIEADPGVWE